MEEIKEGEWIRTNGGRIDKVLKIEHFSDGDIHLTIKHSYIYIRANDVTKHSKNLTDILEEGDIVNGQKIELFYADDDDESDVLGFPIYDDALMDCIEEVAPLQSIKIKTVLTHEQYEQNCFKVEEELK